MEYFSVGHSGAYIYANNGNGRRPFPHHLISEGHHSDPRLLRLRAEYVLYLAEKDYKDYPDISARNPEARLYVSWILDK